MTLAHLEMLFLCMPELAACLFLFHSLILEKGSYCWHRVHSVAIHEWLFCRLIRRKYLFSWGELLNDLVLDPFH